mmetsp:Transcript_90/g.322  ORF Transcript_90/g.322 Transcript_90/m.322 type:complete len:307 (-) Transcript_90:113-1033(-)
MAPKAKPTAKRAASNTPKAKAAGTAKAAAPTRAAAQAKAAAPAKAVAPTRSVLLAKAAAPETAAGKATGAPPAAIIPRSSEAEPELQPASEKAEGAERQQSEHRVDQAPEASKVPDVPSAEGAGGEAGAVEDAVDRQAEKRCEASEMELKRLAALADGEVTIKYSMYAEKFPIQGHTLTAAAIDEVYCLSDVMPGCFIHLAAQEFSYNEEHEYLKEMPTGTFVGLMAGETYWCYVQQDPEQEKRDQERMRAAFVGVAAGLGDRGSEGESCSCAWGAPCTNPMICKDWDNRFANAIKAGGNPLLFQS